MPRSSVKSPENFVTIATVRHPTEAHMIESILNSRNIECVIKDEHSFGIYWTDWNIFGGVKVQVRESKARLAVRLLQVEEKQTRSSRKERQLFKKMRQNFNRRVDLTNIVLLALVLVVMVLTAMVVFFL